MNLAEVISILVALISLAISITTVYLTYFKPAQVKMLVGRILIIANTYIDTDAGREWGGLSLILPFTFSNWNQIGSSIYRIRLVIERQDNPLKNFDILWTSFISFTDGGSKWENEAVAHPVAIHGQSSLTKLVRFDWNPLRQEKIEIREGLYNLKLYSWTKDRNKPDLKEKISFYLAPEQVTQYQNSVTNNQITPIFINLGESRLPNQVATSQDIISRYGQ